MNIATETLSPAKLITLSVGKSGVRIIADEATFKGSNATNLGRSSLEDTRTLSGSQYFLNELEEGVFVRIGDSTFRSIEAGETFPLPRVGRIHSVTPALGEIPPLVRLPPRAKSAAAYQEGLEWDVSFSIGEDAYDMSLFFDLATRAWAFKRPSYSEEILDYYCPFCGSEHWGENQETFFCYFLSDPRITAFIGKQLVRNRFFTQEALRTSGEWRLKLSLCRAFRA